MRQIYFILTIFILLIASTAHGQTGVVKGQVYDRKENQGFAFANVWLVGTEVGTITELNGNLKIDNVKPLHNLNFACPTRLRRGQASFGVVILSEATV